MKKLFILFSVFLVFLSFAVPCFASNEGLYGHYVSPGTYVFDDILDTVSNEFSYDVPFISNGQSFLSLRLRAAANMFYYYVDGSAIFQVYDGSTESWSNTAYRTIDIAEGFYIYDSAAYSWWVSNTTVAGDYNGHLIDGILSAFASIGLWLGTAFSSLQAIFFVDGALTLVGTLSVLGLAFAVILLLFNMLRSFLKFR